MRRFAFVSLLLASAAPAQVGPVVYSAPLATPAAAAVPAPRDIAYPGTMRLHVDASDTARAIFKVRQFIPVVAPGRMTLLFPEWLPGHHGPDGQIDKVAGLEFYANGQRLTWARDPLDVYAYHVNVPSGAGEVEARFQFLSATQPNQGRVVVTPEIVNVQFGSASLYPAGYYTRRIPVVTSLTLPAGWQAATSMRAIGKAAGPTNTINYEQVSYETLQDSPVFAGRYFRSDPLSHGAVLDTVADDPKDLALPPAVLAKHSAMVDQAIKLFGARHYNRYHFLNAITDELGGIGLEHHSSTEITSEPGYYTDYDNHLLDRNVFPHELVHSWNGKYRRPAGQIVGDFRTPLNNDLMWVYEGQTQFWGNVLEARSGMSSKQDVLDKLAISAAGLDNVRGREWRPLVDTTYDPIIQNRAPAPWGSFQRNEDYYNEGMLIWIEADAIIRQGTGGRRGMDDFARAFFGVNPGDVGVLPYTRDDVIATLNAVHAYDWAGFLRQRVDQVSTRAPLGGFERSGYSLVYTDKMTPAFKDAVGSGANFYYSLGFNANRDRRVTSVRWGSPAFDHALRIGDELVAVGSTAYSGEALETAVRSAQRSGQPVSLTVKRGDDIRVINIAYTGGIRYPRFVKTRSGDGPLDILLRPR
ncbi:MAG TPA: PDZ domain-containing protein [Sphingomicrobium sp.]|nr:PDZ domain-containing protein [Sphingomicrobium sp.]